MDIDQIILECSDRMDKTTEYLRRELRGIRTGRANTALLEFIKVDYYGSSTDLRELAALNVADSQQLVIKPFDPGSKNDIIKAIELADLGLNPQVDGQIIRVNVPAPTSDRRKQLGTQVRKLAEDSKVALRNERRDAMKAIDATKSEQKLSDDDVSRSKEEVESEIKKHVAAIDEISTKKISEIEET
jgi:ribosome recycling factor